MFSKTANSVAPFLFFFRNSRIACEFKPTLLNIYFLPLLLSDIERRGNGNGKIGLNFWLELSFFSKNGYRNLLYEL